MAGKQAALEKREIPYHYEYSWRERNKRIAKNRKKQRYKSTNGLE